MKKYTAALLAFGMVGTASAQIFDFNHTWDGTEPTMALRLFRDGVPSVYGTPKVFPGTLPGPVFFQTYEITNNLGVEARLDTTTSSTGTIFHSFTAVYMGTFDPNNLATNYWGDEGGSPSNTVPTSASYGPFANGQVITIMVGSLNTTTNVGNGYNVHAELTPVPEPTTFIALGLGLAALAARRFRKNS